MIKLVGKEGSFMQTEISMKESGRTTRHMGLANTFTPTELAM